VQAVAFELVQFMNEQHRKEAAPADMETAITRALESGGEYFANVWSDAGKEGQAILREITPLRRSRRRQSAPILSRRSARTDVRGYGGFEMAARARCAGRRG
jgi:hypothetical protein